MERLKAFFKTLNTFDPHLQFTMEVGGRSLHFLDLLIYIENNRIETSVYNSKPTACICTLVPVKQILNLKY